MPRVMGEEKENTVRVLVARCALICAVGSSGQCSHRPRSSPRLPLFELRSSENDTLSDSVLLFLLLVHIENSKHGR